MNRHDIVATDRSEQNVALLDPWTVVHFGAGLAAGLVRMHAGAALGAAIGYEIVEQIGERHEVGQELFETSRPESIPNSVMDVAAFMAGHWLGRLWNRES